MPDPQTQTTASPSDQAAPHQQSAQAAVDASRQPTPATPAATDTRTSEAPAAGGDRPDYLPEAFWDPDKKAAKTDDLKGAFERLKADEDRRASLPKSADEYKTELPKDFKLPENWEIKGENPLWAIGRAFAHKNGLSQEQFSELAAGYVQNDINIANAANEYRKALEASLGPNSGARIEALTTWMKAQYGAETAAEYARDLTSKSKIEGWERTQSAMTSQGVTSFSGSGREEGGPKPGEIPGYENMSFVEKFRNRRQTAA